MGGGGGGGQFRVEESQTWGAGMVGMRQGG